MQGTIVKGIAGFYYIHIQECGIVECKAKGVFRKEQIKPLVGDQVQVEMLDEEEKKGVVTRILPRKNQLIRPAVANVDQAIVVFSLTKPAPNFNLLDRFLIMMEQVGLPVVICFNKMDLSLVEERKRVEEIYGKACQEVIFSSTVDEQGIQQILQSLQGKVSTIAGPSGVGKSSIINLLQSGVQMEIGEISTKIARGKHTTRHSELLTICKDTYIMDTPGFTSLSLFDLKKEELSQTYQEFREYESTCKYKGCSHIHEPSCGVKEAVENGYIHPIRYDNYKLLYKELEEKRKY
ncbi:MAG: ribosome small subunit-dependent GTPase A [Eubacteriales bacterium]